MSQSNTQQPAAAKASAKSTAVNINIRAGETIGVFVTNIAKHPDGGIIVNVPGNPRGFIPTSLLAGKNSAAKAARREQLVGNPGTQLDVLVVKAQLVAAKVEDGKTIKGERARIILNEDYVTYGRMVKARKEAAAALLATIATLNVGAWMMATVTSIAFSQGNGQCFGAFVELENGLPALLHKSEMLAPVEIGEKIYVAIRALRKDGDETKVSVSQKLAEDKLEGLTTLQPGAQCSCVVQAASRVSGIEGWPVLVDGCLRAFLPLSEVDDSVALRSRPLSSLDVVVMPLLVGDHVRLTRRPEVIAVLRRVVR